MVDGVEVLDAWLDHVNRSIENVARFAAYKTSREMGRSVAKSIWDAKEISVNFNKKGSGAKFLGANGQTALGNIASLVSGSGRGMYVFWNAGIQGIDNFAKAAKKNPGKAATLATAAFVWGIVTPMLNSFISGDDEKYMMLPEHVRRNNLCINLGFLGFLGENYFATIPLSLELRPFYGAGEYISNMVSGREEWDGLKVAGLFSQLLPIDMLEGGAITEGDFVTPFMPSLAAPVWQAYIKNKSWTGLPVWRDSDFDKEYVPQHRRVYKGTSPMLVEFTKKLNRLGGGNDVEKGVFVLDVNPAKIEHVLEGYLGGYTTQFRQVSNLIGGVTGLDEDYEFDPKDVPILSRLVRRVDPERAAPGIVSKFYEYRNIHKETKSLLREHSRRAVNPRLTEEERAFSAERVTEIHSSDAFKITREYEKYRKAYDVLYKRAKEDDSRENRKAVHDLMREVNRAVKESVK